jgi:hypothetical protein
MLERKSRASGGQGVPDGPWSNLPVPEPPPREPLLKRRKAAREPWIRNWKGLAIIGFLLFIAPPLAGWLSRVILSMVQGG